MKPVEEYHDYDEFIEKVCSRCRYKEVCDEYEFRYGIRLASRVHGIVRCPMYEED